MSALTHTFLSGICLTGSLILCSSSLALAAEIAPTTGEADERGNAILKGEKTTPAQSKTKKSRRRARPSRFAEKPLPITLPEPGEDPEDDGGADDVPLPTHPLLRRAVLNRDRAEAKRSGALRLAIEDEAFEDEAIEDEAIEDETPTSAPAAAEELEPKQRAGLFFGLGALLVLVGAGAWLFNLSRAGFGSPGGQTK